MESVVEDFPYMGEALGLSPRKFNFLKVSY
jgi:hypothetical protein